jgi:hypothetical protein
LVVGEVVFGEGRLLAIVVRAQEHTRGRREKAFDGRKRALPLRSAARPQMGPSFQRERNYDPHLLIRSDPSPFLAPLAPLAPSRGFGDPYLARRPRSSVTTQHAFTCARSRTDQPCCAPSPSA